MRVDARDTAQGSAFEPAISVVIATLGGPTLADTLQMLNQGSVEPAEILVCIPQREAQRVQGLDFANLRVLVTECRGQVAQRIQGFRAAASPLVLQLDDDMLPAPDCLQRLCQTLLAHGSSCAVAPAMVDRTTGISAYRKPVTEPWVLRIYYWLMNGSQGYVPGYVDRAGNAVGVDADAVGHQKVVHAEWLAGGCVLHYKSNLLLENYFPFPGKAYGEDVIHSHLLRSRGIELLVDTDARCALDLVYAHSMSWRDFWKNLRGDWRARRYAMALRGRSSPRIVFIYLVSIAGYLARRILRRRAA
ncbi:hypothetical protein DLREEDagrD3_22420 [Denitratisoma sp. agr-D3]